MTRVKICGIREVAHAAAAIEAGADYLGFNFYPRVRRYIDPGDAEAILRAVDRSRTQIVGIFVNEAPATVRSIADRLNLDLIQLSGDEGPACVAELGRPVARTVHVSASTTLEDIERGRGPAAYIHLDCRQNGQYGGTGVPIDWGFAGRVSAIGPVFLAGGLTPENVAEAIRVARPFAVDVASGVEVDGRKHPERIRAFVAAARAA
ncbi:MAG: phosphoribosylanthranilate isomerase [Chloroflexi bacterium]|nr:phosphoribosylanthranilate isomerase [Chloroflexota bacterium]